MSDDSGFAEKLAALTEQLKADPKPEEEMRLELKRLVDEEQSMSPEVRELTIQAALKDIANARLEKLLLESRAKALVAEFMANAKRREPEKEEESSGGWIGKVVNVAVAIVVVFFLEKNNPTQKEFDSFIANEGFVVPAVERDDLFVASYYKVRGRFTDEQRSYLGVFHHFIPLPKSAPKR
jgi:hypothetical protein